MTGKYRDAGVPTAPIAGHDPAAPLESEEYEFVDLIPDMRLHVIAGAKAILHCHRSFKYPEKCT